MLIANADIAAGSGGCAPAWSNPSNALAIDGNAATTTFSALAGLGVSANLGFVVNGSYPRKVVSLDVSVVAGWQLNSGVAAVVTLLGQFRAAGASVGLNFVLGVMLTGELQTYRLLVIDIGILAAVNLALAAAPLDFGLDLYFSALAVLPTNMTFQADGADFKGTPVRTRTSRMDRVQRVMR